MNVPHEALTVQAPYNPTVIRNSFKDCLDKQIWAASNLNKGKLPINPRNGSHASCTDTKTLGTFAEADAYCQSNPDHAPAIALSPELGYVCIDIDNLPSTELPQDLKTLLHRCSTYAERSVSGKGVHIFAKAKKPGSSCKKGNREIYSTKKFITLTGHVLEGYAEVVEAQDAIDEVYSDMFSKTEAREAAAQWKHSPKMSDDEILTLCRKAKNSDKFMKLFDKKDLSGYREDASGADLGLCSMLAFYTQDPQQIDQLFRKSSLIRNKWDRENYREKTISTALKGLTETYQPEKRKGLSPEQEGSTEERSEHKKRMEKLIEGILEPKNPCANFKIEDLPTVLKDYVSALCETTDSHPVLVTIAALGQLSAFVQKKVCIPEGEYYQTLRPNMWALTIQESGGFKTTGMNKACKFVFRRENDLNLAERDINEKGNNSDDSVSKITLEAEKQAFRNKKISQSVLLPTRVTPEGLLEHLSEGHGGIILSSEFGDWLETMEASHNRGLKALFTDLYDIPSFYSYKTRTQGYLKIQEPFISICGVSTIDWIQNNIDPKEVSSGFFARFLLFCPPKHQNIPDALPRKKQSNTAAENAMKELLERLPPERSYTLPPNTCELFEAVHNEMYRQARAHSEKCVKILEPYLKRWSPYLLKLSMLMQLCIDPNSKEIGIEALSSAMAVLEPAIKSTVHLFESELGESDHRKKCRKVREYIAKRTGHVKRSALIKSDVLEGGTKDYDYVMETLTQSEEVRLLHGEQPKEEWVYVLQAK